MSISAALTAYMNSTSSITNVIGSRCYPSYQLIADKTYPAAIYKVEDVSSIKSYGGEIQKTQSCQIVLDIIGATYAQADAACSAICNALDCFHGTWGTMPIQGCFLNDDGIIDDVATEAETEQIIFHIKQATFTVWYVNP